MEEILKRLDQIEQDILGIDRILTDHRKSLDVIGDMALSVSKRLSDQYGKLLPEVRLATHDVGNLSASFDRHADVSTKLDLKFSGGLLDTMDMIAELSRRLDKLEGR